MGHTSKSKAQRFPSCKREDIRLDAGCLQHGNHKQVKDLRRLLPSAEIASCGDTFLGNLHNILGLAHLIADIKRRKGVSRQGQDTSN